MASNPATELASAIQSISINRNPDPEHDINPSTASSKRYPVEVVSPSTSPQTSPEGRAPSISSTSTPSSIASDVLRPLPRRRTLPPFPDFRFEQSYLASLKTAETKWQVAYITVRDQVIWPLISGIAYNLIMFGWRHWNRDANFKGQSLGAKVRKWWWGVNNWKLPANVDSKNLKKAKDAEEFFVNKFGSGQGD